MVVLDFSNVAAVIRSDWTQSLNDRKGIYIVKILLWQFSDISFFHMAKTGMSIVHSS